MEHLRWDARVANARSAKTVGAKQAGVAVAARRALGYGFRTQTASMGVLRDNGTSLTRKNARDACRETRERTRS